VKYNDPPKYISQDDFKKIVLYIQNNSVNNETALRNECIVRIMFECGLRLGEALGSTLEDYVLEEKYDKSFCTLYIRNRVTNLPYQNAKTCMNVWDKKNYTSNDYRTKNVGYQTVFPSTETYDLIMEYFDDAHDRAFKKYKNAYNSKAKADVVSEEFKKEQKENFYVFINSKGTPLSSTSWNKVLRNIFESVGLTVDYGVKKNNLSHRFRHGFIMELIQGQKLRIETVKVLARHRNITSLARYYNPTTKDLLKNKTEIEEMLNNQE
jgi:integrase/recombinase XerD